MNKNANAGTSPDRNKGTQSCTGMLQHQTEKQDAGILMPAASTLMPMLSYAMCPALGIFNGITFRSI
jgi:hypothetical protein